MGFVSLMFWVIMFAVIILSTIALKQELRCRKLQREVRKQVEEFERHT